MKIPLWLFLLALFIILVFAYLYYHNEYNGYKEFCLNNNLNIEPFLKASLKPSCYKIEGNNIIFYEVQKINGEFKFVEK
jgi:hypothetical protein